MAKKMTDKINPQIFREYDIRGIVDQDLTAVTVELSGDSRICDQAMSPGSSGRLRNGSRRLRWRRA